jgi:hypothetical protein
MTEIIASMHSVDHGRKWSVEFDGEMVVQNSRDPEPDLARALLARGLTGRVTLLDGETGKPRVIIDIESAAKVRTVETGTCPRFRRIETCAESPPAAETPMSDSRPLKDTDLVAATTIGEY